MKLKLYVVMVALLATGTAVLVQRPAGAFRANLWELLAMGFLVALAEAFQVRYHHRTNINAFNLMEGILALLVFAGGGRPALIATACAILVGDCSRRNSFLKVVFNVAQWTLAVGTADVVFVALSGSSGRSATALPALMLAILTMSAVNQIALNLVLYLATGRVFGATGGRKSVLIGLAGHAVTIGINLVAGVCLSAAYMWSPFTLLAGVVIVVGTYAAGHANAALRADHVRLEGMQRATHTLASALDTATGLPGFLAEAREGFEAQEAELVLFSDRGATVHTCTAANGDGYAVGVRRHDLAEAVASRLVEPTRFAAGDGTVAGAILARTDHTRVIAAPLCNAGTTIGVLFLYDRIGMEGFEAGELKIADALTRELVGFLERVELLQAVDGERRKLADILESTSDGILSIAADGTITSWNAGLATSTGYAADEMVGTRHFGLLRPRDAAGRDVLIERWVEQIDSSTGMPLELQVVSAAGQTVWLSCSYSRIPAGEDRDDVLVVVARNTTQARELEKLKDDFVAVVSHELRTPLVPIKGWAQTLLNRGDRLSDDQRRTAVQSILAQAQKLESLVLNILEASRIEAGRVDGDGIADVGAIVVRIVEDSLASRPDRVVRLSPSTVPCNVRGSAVWVERAVSNLLANAIKYSPDESAVDVSISVAGDSVLVSVIDRGPGIALDAQERIFERFERLEETRKQTGTGLGLYITRRLARAMGGEVSVSSVPGEGSTFLLRLPMAPVGSIPTSVDASSSSAGSGGSGRSGGSGSSGGSSMPEQRSKLRSVNVVNLR